MPRRVIHYIPSTVRMSLTDIVKLSTDLFDDTFLKTSKRERSQIENLLHKMPSYMGDMIQRHIACVFTKNSKNHISFGYNYLNHERCVQQSSVHAEEAALRSLLRSLRLSDSLKRLAYGKWCFLPEKGRGKDP
jgi:hypothetical protein